MFKGAEFKLIVAGGRDFNDYYRLSAALHELANGVYKNHAVSIVSGMARGADIRAVRFAREHNVMLYEFPADWNRFGNAAGIIRNEEMGRFADGVLAFWDGKSRGTKHMVSYMERLNKHVHLRSY